MCGIVGIINRINRVQKTSIEIMCDTLTHRGPDDRGVYVHEKLALGQRRLSIIDLSPTGHQPFSIQDEELTIVYNGEIYNHLEIREDLSQLGYKFRGSSDTETIIYGYHQWGKEIFNKLNGIFAIAIYEKIKNKLTLARDRFGVKPLYYHINNESLQFGSEIKALLSQGVKAEIDYRALHEFLYYGYTMKERTLYRNIFKLLPGHVLEMDLSFERNIVFTQFWKHEDLLPENSEISEKEAIDTTRKLLESAVKRQLLSDVPVGVFLSGGIDSSAITAYATKHYARKLDTFSAGFDFNEGHDELPMAKRIAQKYGTNHHEIYIEGGNLADVIVKMVKHHDKPFSDAANIPLYLMTQKVKETCTVILQGDGGDEMFAGYPRYHILQMANLYRYGLMCATPFKSLLPTVLKNRIERFNPIFREENEGRMFAKLLTVESEACSPINVLSASTKNKVEGYNPFDYYEELAERFANLSGLPQKMLWIDTLILLPDQFLEKVDKSTMASGVEVRVPFLDNELSSFAMRLPGKMKLKGGVKKYILKKALEGEIPNEVLYGPKKGFGVPYSNWIRQPLYQFMVDRIHSPYIKNLNILNYTYINELVDDHREGRKDNGFILWKLLNLCIWLEEFKVDLP